MRLIGKLRLASYWKKHRDAKQWLEHWCAVVEAAEWKHLPDARETFPHADGGVKVGSGGTVTVFNVCGNKHRLVTAIKYEIGAVFILRIMTHAEYGRERWKESL